MTCDRCNDIHRGQLNGNSNKSCQCTCHDKHKHEFMGNVKTAEITGFRTKKTSIARPYPSQPSKPIKSSVIKSSKSSAYPSQSRPPKDNFERLLREKLEEIENLLNEYRNKFTKEDEE